MYVCVLDVGPESVLILLLRKHNNLVYMSGEIKSRECMYTSHGAFTPQS